MSYRVEFEPEAIVDLDRMASSIRERILRKINWLALNLDSMAPEALKGELSGFFKREERALCRSSRVSANRALLGLPNCGSAASATLPADDSRWQYSRCMPAVTLREVV